MNPFITDYCPICRDRLTIWDRDNTPGYILYECSAKHYTYSQNESTTEPIYSSIAIPGFRLMYDRDMTAIFKRDELGSKWLFNLPGHVQLDWKNLEAASKRLKKLMVFL